MRAPILAVILASIPALAAADEGTSQSLAALASPAAETGVAAPAAAPAAPADAAGVAEDPNIDKTLLLPTAETQPAGTFSFNDYELLLLGGTYGVTDDFQITATTLAPIVEDMPVYLSGSAKWRVLKTPRFRLALQGSLAYVSFDDLIGDGEEGGSDDSVVTATGGVIGSLCLDAGCHSLATVSVTAVKPLSEDTDGIAFIYDASVSARLNPHTKLLAEVTSAGGSDGNGGFESADSGLFSYGVRFHSKNVATDIAFIRSFGDDGDDDDFILGIPFVNVTYRQ
jgi:hypothetical protein